eukprot:CAMPEP_0118994736 /NCGR_PEP_ID=MMETSP1173-20130426/57309_1 /TAXON_ID=1034831 /ORGANISM="Rhizochromulina marina cf, Strain CCMP1243" /LENGTH=43 /DNA_ID= /DNA_START= /DNA_END= /DNA_ORIENTATION=
MALHSRPQTCGRMSAEEEHSGPLRCSLAAATLPAEAEEQPVPG